MKCIYKHYAWPVINKACSNKATRFQRIQQEGEEDIVGAYCHQHCFPPKTEGLRKMTKQEYHVGTHLQWNSPRRKRSSLPF